MSIIQQHTSASLSDAWRTINIDALTEDSSVNFDTSTLHPPQPEITEADVRGLSGQVRQLLRGGDAEGALRGCLETPVYNGTDAAKSIKASDMTPLLKRIYESPGGSECLDVLMKYIYKGMAASHAGRGAKVTPQPTGGFSQFGARPGASNEPASAGMSVMLSWHEKLVEVAGLGCIGRTMTDWRRV
ncbi:hypothetical protein G3M48_000280 [Beauveria asiatica]|uniref:Actin-related protein 2/3 complex subunit 5 n=1 Tax=Beauveria asiatica TaxID=1069075 RepID=A0AAW0RH40_9HYPO